MSDPNESRLVRMESKIDQLHDAVATLARIDERMLNHMETARRMGTQIEKLQVDIKSLQFTHERFRGAVLVVAAFSSTIGAIVGKFWG